MLEKCLALFPHDYDGRNLPFMYAYLVITMPVHAKGNKLKAKVTDNVVFMQHYQNMQVY